jgi:putative toxin-antitoxin system antitoxin component (TIGR02293 family)
MSKTVNRPALLAGDDAGAAAQSADSSMFHEIVTGPLLIGLPAIGRIRQGIGAEILRSASSFFGVSQARIQQITQVSGSTAARLERANARIDAAATERIYRMAAVTRHATDVFENEGAAIAWMRQPNPGLGGNAPLDLMDTEPGAASVRLVLNAIATGGVA